MKKISKEIKIGIAFIIALIMLYYGISYLKGINKLKPSQTYTVVFDNIEGLHNSSPIKMNGFQIGLVSAIKLDPKTNKVIVSLNMDKGVEITKGSKVILDVSMLAGGNLILEQNPYTEEILTVNDTIFGMRKKGLMDVADSLSPQMGLMIPKIDSILTGIQILVNSPDLSQSFANINEITNNLALATNRLNNLSIALGKDIPEITSNINGISKDISGLTQQLEKIDVVSTFKSLDSTVKNFESISTKISDKDNSLGLLLNDRQLYDSLNHAIGSASSLLEDIKKEPQRYINVKIF